jgi:hypothetical protein
MTEISDVSRRDDNDWSAAGADVVYSGRVLHDDGSLTLENGAVSLDELTRAAGAINELKLELAKDPVDATRVEALLAAIASIANEIGSDAPVVRDTLLAIGDLAGHNISSSFAAINGCLDLCSSASLVITQIRPPLSEVILFSIVHNGSAAMKDDIESIKGDLDLSREASAALSDLQSCLGNTECTPAEFKAALARLESASADLDGKAAFADLKTAIDAVVDDMESYIDTSNSTLLNERLAAYRSGTLLSDGSIHDPLSGEIPEGLDYVSTGMDTNIQRLASTSSSISDLGVQDYTEALSNLKRMIEISQSVLSSLKDAVMAVARNMKG